MDFTNIRTMDKPAITHARTHSIGYVDGKEPHALSLKVLRLTRPSISTQNTLPFPPPSSTLAHSIPRSSSLAYPSAPTDSFSLSPLLTLPPEFGNAYVGETFSCTLCANNELENDTSTQRIHGVKIEAEMKTPTTVVSVPVAYASDAVRSKDVSAESSRQESEDEEHDDPLRASSSATTTPKPKDTDVELAPAQSVQGIINYHLREDGPHVLSVTVSYTSSTSTSGRVRSFRKLYQFAATPALVVRTKIGAVRGAPKQGAGIKSRDSMGVEVRMTPGGEQKSRTRKGEGWALEAQLENVGEEGVVLESVDFLTDEWCKATSLSDAWCHQHPREGEEGVVKEKQVLSRGGVHQACFFVKRVEGKEQDGKLAMGVLNIKWRGPMGNVGELSTGWLGLRK